jgi:hypothetical protein
MKHINLIDIGKRKTQYDILVDPYETLCNLEDPASANVLRELRKKYSSYKSQDKQKHKFDTDQHITFDQLIQKLKDSNLQCYYCTKPMMLLYNRKREQQQWTLERINNNLGHYNENTCVSCLKCNLARRTDSHDYFKMGKQLQVVKSE